MRTDREMRLRASAWLALDATVEALRRSWQWGLVALIAALVLSGWWIHPSAGMAVLGAECVLLGVALVRSAE